MVDALILTDDLLKVVFGVKCWMVGKDGVGIFMDMEAEFLKFYMFETPWAFIDPIPLYLFDDELAKFIYN